MIRATARPRRCGFPTSRFRLHLAHANLGFAAANNLAAADCESPWVATLNPDAIAGKTWLEELRSATLRHPGVKMFGSTQLDARKPDRVDGFGDVYSVFGTAWRGASGSPVSALPPDDREVFAPCAAAALYARDAYRTRRERFRVALRAAGLAFDCASITAVSTHSQKSYRS